MATNKKVFTLRLEDEIFEQNRSLGNRRTPFPDELH